MPANKNKAENFVREATKALSELRKKYEIDRNDLTLILRVAVIDSVGYNEHEDED